MRNRIQQDKNRLGPMESRFFALAQMKRWTIVRPGMVAPALGLTMDQERDLLRRLNRAGWIVRLQRGIYLVPASLPVGGCWNPPESVVLPALMRERRAQYQICGPGAFNRYGFDEQVPNRLFIYNSRISGSRQIGSTRYTFVRVANTRLGSVEEARTPDGTTLRYSSKIRSLMDALYDWSVFNTLPRALEWVRQELRKDPAIAAELARTAILFGNQATLRRLGYLLQQCQASARVLCMIRKALRNSVSLIAMVPSELRRGAVIKEWGIIDNEKR